MNVKCQYKRSYDGSLLPVIFCRIRYSFGMPLSKNEKQEILNAMAYERNVPEYYKEMHDSISKLFYGSRDYYPRDIILITEKDGTCCIDVVLNFHIFSKFESFITENGLIAEAL